MRTWYVGTRYHFADTYAEIIKRGAAIPRIHAATDTGTKDGNPVLLTQEAWEQKVRESSEATIACQQLLNPLAGQLQEFKPDWLRRYEIRPEILSIAITVDPANSRKKESCNTAMVVSGLDCHWNRYLLDGLCHKLDLGQRWKWLKYFRKKWLRAPGIQVVKVGYERYGMQSDIDHFTIMMDLEKYHFPIQEVAWADNVSSQAKDDRIRRLIPDFQNWRFFLPYEGQQTKIQTQYVAQGRGHLVARPIVYKDHDNKPYNVVSKWLANEWNHFPFTVWKDFFDAMSRVYDVDLRPPLLPKDTKAVIPPYVGEA